MANHRKPPQSPRSLATIGRMLENWRSRPDRGRNIPEEIWGGAVELAAVHGAYRIAHELRLNYYSLKKRASGAASQSLSSAGFIEIPIVPCDKPANDDARVEVISPLGWRVLIPASLMKQLGSDGVSEMFGALPS